MMPVEKKRISWGEREEMVLLDLWAERADDLRRAKRNNHIFVEISKEMGSKFTAEEIHVKIRNMTKKYREENKNMESSEASPSAWKHFEAVHRILGHTPENSEETCDSFSTEEEKKIMGRDQKVNRALSADCGRTMLNQDILGEYSNSTENNVLVDCNEIIKSNLIMGTTKTEPIGQKDIVEMSNELRSKILNHTYRIRKITGRQSKVFDVFGRIIDENGREIENYVVCKECLKVFRFINSSSNLVKHKCYASKKTDQATPVYASVDSEAIQSLQNAILKWNIESLRPFEIVEDSNLQKLITFFISMGAKYGENVDIDDLLPQAADVAKRIERMYRDALLGLKDELNSTRNVGYALTADVWNIKYIHESFLFVTIHFIENGELFHRFLGMETMDNQEYTSADVKEAIQDLISEFDLTLNNGDIIVTNNNEKMVDAFSTNNRISCINYLLDSALEEALNITPDISEICDNSGTLYNFLSEIDTFEDAAANVLSTRWNRTYNMLSFLITNWDKVVETCQTDEKSMEGLNLSHITALVDVLKPFKESFKALNEEKCITLHLVIVHVHRLRKLCVKSQYDSDIIKKFKVNLLASFDKFVLGNMTVLHKLALYLFPPANKMISFTQIEKELVRSECKKLMKLFIDEDTDEFAQSTIQIDDKDPLTEFLEDFDELPSTSTVTKSITSSELFSDFVAPTECVSSADEKVLNEMRLYEEAIVSLQGDFDLLQWWHTHQPQYPLLYKVSCKILAAPAGSMIVEKVILKARSLIYESRGANSDSDLVNETLFLHFNKDQKENPRDVTMDTTI